ncbi:hypothetical protein ACFPRL_01485 [Pseudoclavibacter helvolus]
MRTASPSAWQRCTCCARENARGAHRERGPRKRERHHDHAVPRRQVARHRPCRRARHWNLDR